MRWVGFPDIGQALCVIRPPYQKLQDLHTEGTKKMAQGYKK